MTFVAYAYTVILSVVDPPADWFVEALRGLGVPGAIIGVLGYTLRKFFIWATPHAEAMITAYVKRQDSMATCQEKLTDSTIEIQQKNTTMLEAIQKQLSGVCRMNANQNPK